MKSIATIILVASALLGSPAHAQEPENIAKAEAAATAWLALVDKSDYSGSWDRAADLFQSTVSKISWEGAVRAARPPLGSIKARELKSAKFTRTLPGAPDGEYVVIQYTSKFEHKANAIETVTPLREKDGSWKVSGYFVK